MTITGATGINEAGQIAAVGKMSASAEDHALLLTPPLLNRLAYAWANNPTAASYTPQAQYAFNSTGGPIHITGRLPASMTSHSHACPAGAITAFPPR